MKIITNNITLECSDDLFESKNSVKNIIDVINTLKDAPATNLTSINMTALDDISILKNADDIKGYNVAEQLDRKRLPNSDRPRENKVEGKRLNNVVDLKELDIEKPKNVNYFRCPDCGQSVVINIKNISYIKSLESGMIHPVEIDTDTVLNTVKDYYSLLLTAVDFEPITICDTDEVNGFCIKCGKTHTLHEFIDAYENPEDYFEHDKICPLCGGEVCEHVNGHERINKCEKCDYKEEVKND